jgi:hypothetical protein
VAVRLSNPNSMPGHRWTTEEARHAVKRKRGLKAWSTRLARGEAHLQIEINRLALDYANETRRLKNALGLLAGERVIRCQCSGCLALKYAADSGLIRAELDARKTLLNRQIRELRRVWQRQRYEAAMARARSSHLREEPP